MSPQPTPAPQPGIFATGTRYHHHLEFDLHDVPAGRVVAAVGELRESHVNAGATNLVVGFGPRLWQRICAGDGVPEGLGDFAEVHGIDGHVAPATQHDIWVWVHGSGVDEVLDTVRAVVATFAEVGTLAVDCPCFVYHDSRDLTGFIDGSANPAPGDAPAVACIPEGEPGAGGSHVMTQRWVHDLASFDELEVPEQERVIGRTKLDSVELPAEVRPPDSHITRAEIHDAAGEERPIYRRSTPFGTAGEQGLYFLAFSAERDRFDEMLAGMYGTDGSIRDRLLDFSTPVTGSYYFAPSAQTLLELSASAN